MAIIIGRDAQTRQLNVVKDGVAKKFGQSGSVPMDVSRQHISLTPAGTGKWQIKNLNDKNVTFVNGVAVENMTISEGDKVELGNSHYLFQWEAVKEPKVETVDIRPLKRVWEEYDKERLQLDITERKFNVIRSGTGIIGMLAIACAFIFGQGSLLQIILYGLAIGVAGILFIIALKKAEDVILQRRELSDRFEKKYVCPKCGFYLGKYGKYDILSQNDACPHCKTKYVK